MHPIPSRDASTTWQTQIVSKIMAIDSRQVQERGAEKGRLLLMLLLLLMMMIMMMMGIGLSSSLAVSAANYNTILLFYDTTSTSSATAAVCKVICHSFY